MTSPGVQLTLSAQEATTARKAAATFGVSCEALFAAFAAAYAREHGFREGAAQALWGRGSPFWGPPPAPEPRPEALFVPLDPLALELSQQAAAHFKFQGSKGDFRPVTLAEYVLGATLRSLEAGRPFPLPAAAAPLAEAPPPPAHKPLLGSEGKLVLGVAIAVTVVVLGGFLGVRAFQQRQAPAAPPVPLPSGAPPLESKVSALDPEEDEFEPFDPHRAPKVPLFTPRSAAPSVLDADNIDELLNRHYGRPKVPARPSPKGAGGPAPWAPRGAGATYGALAELLEVVPSDQAFDVAIAQAVADVAPIHQVPPALVRAIIRRESNFNPKAVSRTGAIGLMQVMPFNAERVGLSERELWIPEKNILGGVRLLAVLLKYYQGDVISALTAYNARPRKLFAPVPRNGETPAYIAAVLHYFQEYSGAPLRDAFDDKTGKLSSPQR